MVELSAVNRSVVGSNPTCGAMAPGQAVKTPPFHGGNTGSSPVGVIQTEVKYRFCFLLLYSIMESCPSWPKEHAWKVCRRHKRLEGSNPHSPLFVCTSLNLVKQNVDLTGFCYILLTFVKPRKSN